MRGTLTLVFVILFSQLSWSEPLKVEDLHKKSEALLSEAAKAKTDSERATKLLDLKKTIDTTLDTYRAKNLEEVSEAHEAAALFFYTIEPVFDFVEQKKKPTACAPTEGKIRSEDAQGRTEGAQLTKNASIALAWLKIFCK